jgi:pilin isopeptide linkage protein
MKKKWTEKLKKVSAVLAAAVLAASVCAPATAVFADGGNTLPVPIDMKESLNGISFADGPLQVDVGSKVYYEASIDMTQLASIAQLKGAIIGKISGTYTMTVTGTDGLLLSTPPTSSVFTDYFSGPATDLFELAGSPDYNANTRVLTITAKVQDKYATDGITGTDLYSKLSQPLVIKTPTGSEVTVNSFDNGIGRVTGTFSGNIKYDQTNIVMTGVQSEGGKDSTLSGTDSSVSTTVIPSATTTDGPTVTKKLEVPTGTTIPDGTTFTMKFTQNREAPYASTQADVTPVVFSTADMLSTNNVLTMVAAINLPTYTVGGKYHYTVAEESGNCEHMQYDTSEYSMDVWVNDSDVTKKTVTFTKAGIDGKIDDVTFDNKYVKPASFEVSKTVVGDYADKTKGFEYTLTLTQGSVTLGTTSFTAKIYNGNIPTDNTVTFVFGTANSFTLKDGQSLKFDNDLPAGTTYTLTETGTPGYTASAVVTENGATPTTDQAQNTGDKLTLTSKLIGEGTNTAAFTNTYKDVTPTGININNSPFVALILISAAALAVFIFLKKFRMHLEK